MRTLMMSLTLVLMTIPTQGAFAALNANTVAEVNGAKITKDDFDRRYKENIQFFKFEVPTKSNVLNDIINFELAVQEAKKEGLDKDPVVQERMNAVLYQSLVEKKLADKFKSAVDVSEKEARDYCRRNPAVRFSHIYIPLKPTALKSEEKEAYAKIKKAQDALAHGMAFDKAVANFSEGYSSTSAGDTGYVNRMQIDPTLYMEARKMKVGQINKTPVRSSLGLHIMKLTGIQSCKGINIPEWQRMVFDEKRAKIFKDYLGTLRAKAKVSINNELIKE
jgi:hypothetical protein